MPIDFENTLNNARLGLRKKFVDFADLFGGQVPGQAHQDPAGEMHRVASKNLTKAIGRFVPREVAENFADTAGLGNEWISGLLQTEAGRLEGKPRKFFSDKGFDFSDVAANRRGQDEAAKELDEEQIASLQPDNSVKWNISKLLRDAIPGNAAMNYVAKGLRKLPFTY